MSTKTSSVAQNLKPEPMRYTVERVPNMTLERTILAQNAEALSKDEIVRRAEVAQIDLSGARTVEEMVSEVQSQVRGPAE